MGSLFSYSVDSKCQAEVVQLHAKNKVLVNMKQELKKSLRHKVKEQEILQGKLTVMTRNIFNITNDNEKNQKKIDNNKIILDRMFVELDGPTTATL
jgi:hypothetical protein